MTDSSNGHPNAEAAKRAERRNEISLDALVDDYELQSQRLRLGDDGEIEYIPKAKHDDAYEKPKRGQVIDDEPLPKAVPLPGSNTDKLMASAAHIMPIATLLLGGLTGGLSLPIMVLVSLGIYILYKDRSEFVHQNAFAALKGQLIGTLGWVLAVVGIVAVAVALSIVLALTVIGSLLIPFVMLAMVLGILGTVAMPIWLLIHSAVGAYQALQGMVHDYPLPKTFGVLNRLQTLRNRKWSVNI
jgi:uncharacterized Tic20 family protein